MISVAIGGLTARTEYLIHTPRSTQCPAAAKLAHKAVFSILITFEMSTEMRTAATCSYSHGMSAGFFPQLPWTAILPYPTWHVSESCRSLNSDVNSNFHIFVGERSVGLKAAGRIWQAPAQCDFFFLTQHPPFTERVVSRQNQARKMWKVRKFFISRWL